MIYIWLSCQDPKIARACQRLRNATPGDDVWIVVPQVTVPYVTGSDDHQILSNFFANLPLKGDVWGRGHVTQSNRIANLNLSG